ncbi:NUDIX domain-containing protein [Actinosynnema sp. CS-041913]|uniref:NUDIX domain-containing protein n=1 Tax=Actinosynnema sp. CS-041913 TaxID=3239917 RepID=UPI003D94649E
MTSSQPRLTARAANPHATPTPGRDPLMLPFRGRAPSPTDRSASNRDSAVPPHPRPPGLPDPRRAGAASIAGSTAGMAGTSTREDNDPERFRWLAEGNARQARKRVSAKVVICDKGGRVLLVNPTYKQYWDLPGGMAEANESPITAAVREVEEELGFTT